MKKILDCIPLWWKLLMLLNVILVIVSFIIPPLGVIDTSVLTAVGEITVMGLIGMVPYYLESGKHIKVSKGDTEIELNGSHREGFIDNINE